MRKPAADLSRMFLPRAVLFCFVLASFALTSGSIAAQETTTAASGPSAREKLGPPRGAPLSGDELEAKASHVASLLRCPVCQGLSIDDSPAPMARNMSLEVRDLMAAGYDQEQVLKYFESSYGEFVLLQPPLRGVNWLVWLAPAIALILGGAAVWFAMRKMTKQSGDRTTVDAAAPVEPEPVDPELERYLAAARNLATDGAAAKPPAAGTTKGTS